MFVNSLSQVSYTPHVMAYLIYLENIIYIKENFNSTLI